MEADNVDMTALTQAIAGNAQALQQLLTDHHSRLLGYVSKHLPVQVRNLVDPTDIVQDTCFEACRLIGSFKPAGNDSLFRWLATIARHRMVDLLRIHQSRNSGGPGEHRPNDSLTTVISELAVYRRTPSRSAASHEFLAAVEQAIHRLPPTYKQVVTLRHIEGLSATEIATRMNRTPEAIYWLCSRALDAIRQDLRSASLFI